MRRILLFLTPLIFGIVSVIFGIIIGTTSHQVTYQQGKKGVIAHFLATQTTGYLQMQGSSTLYVIQEQNFTPPINGVQTFTDGETISFTYTTDETVAIDVTSKIGTHLVGTASTIVAITAYDPNQQTQAQQIFMTTQYSQHPQGYYHNNWGLGGALLLAGLVLCGLSILLMRPTKKTISSNQIPPLVTPEVSAVAQNMRQPTTQVSSPSGTHQFLPSSFAAQPITVEQPSSPSGTHQFLPSSFQSPTQHTQPISLPPVPTSHTQMGLPSQPITKTRRSLLSYASQAQQPSLPIQQSQQTPAAPPQQAQLSAPAWPTIPPQLPFPSYPQVPFPPSSFQEESDMPLLQQPYNPPSQQ